MTTRSTGPGPDPAPDPWGEDYAHDCRREDALDPSLRREYHLPQSPAEEQERLRLIVVAGDQQKKRDNALRTEIREIRETKQFRRIDHCR